MIIKLLLILLLPCTINAFDIEKDLWYYEMQDRVPDKFAHFYRSYVMVQVLPIYIVISLDILYEIYDEQRGVQFSYKDLIADCLGAIGGTTFNNKRVKLLMYWDGVHKNITINVIIII